MHAPSHFTGSAPLDAARALGGLFHNAPDARSPQHFDPQAVRLLGELVSLLVLPAC